MEEDSKVEEGGGEWRKVFRGRRVVWAARVEGWGYPRCMGRLHPPATANLRCMHAFITTLSAPGKPAKLKAGEAHPDPNQEGWRGT